MLVISKGSFKDKALLSRVKSNLDTGPCKPSSAFKLFACPVTACCRFAFDAMNAVKPVIVDDSGEDPKLLEEKEQEDLASASGLSSDLK